MNNSRHITNSAPFGVQCTGDALLQRASVARGSGRSTLARRCILLCQYTALMQLVATRETTFMYFFKCLKYVNKFAFIFMFVYIVLLHLLTK